MEDYEPVCEECGGTNDVVYWDGCKHTRTGVYCEDCRPFCNCTDCDPDYYNDLKTSA